MPWAREGFKPLEREDNAPCLGGCGYKLPLYTMAVLRPDQRNHSRKGMCKPCGDREYNRARRHPPVPSPGVDATV